MSLRNSDGWGMKIVIGVDPHKLSVTIEVVDDRERVLATGRCATDNAGYVAMRKHLAAWPERTWAVEGQQRRGPRAGAAAAADGGARGRRAREA